ncbi:MAG: phosphatidate cytidylyltransferase [Treponema sp.]|jgi:phosphatidate cytidylyltransferase|nr:phosphatidate cytidylyltransferase [Treponema sp.]
MKKIVQRLLVFAIGLPLIVGIVVFLPYHNHLALNLLVILFSALGAVEFAAILGRKGITCLPAEAAILGALAPAAMTVLNSFGWEGQVFSAVLILGACWVLLSRIFCSAEGLKDYTERSAAGFSVMLYPGLFMACMVRMTALPRSEMVVLAFLLIVFANDSAAWAVGMLLGRGSRGIIPASPNKSIAGYIGGIAASILVGVAAEIFVGPVFVTRLSPASLGGIVIGLCTGIAANLGDLAESAMKRSSGIKDSGTLIPGRGGVLDSIDSVSLAAPVFYILYRIIF